MNRRPILTLTTDFGGDGPYVAAMKGVVLGLAPDAQLVDVSHAVPPQDIRSGAFVLGSVIDAFPDETVHLAIIDPGVGTSRKPLAIRAGRHWFVAPDNGLVPLALGDRPILEVRELTNPAHRRSPVSSTFHGRDLFAPAAAHLLNSGPPEDLGPIVDGLVRLDDPPPREFTDGWVGAIVFVDQFGNLITNLQADRIGRGPWIATVGATQIIGVVQTYGEHPTGALIALAGSSGRLEIAEVNGHAARRLGVGPGAAVRLIRDEVQR